MTRSLLIVGGPKVGTRNWIMETEYTIPYSNRTVFTAVQSADGSLGREIDF